MKFRSLVLTAVLLLAMPLSAQSTHSSLKDPQLLKRFQQISHAVMCQCGCNMPLYYCNHIGHCNAWPMRQAIDSLLAEGYSDEQIINGFVYGFGELVDTHPAFTMTRSEEYSYLVPKFREGLGETGLTQPKSSAIGLYLILGALGILGFTILFIRNRLKKRAAATTETMTLSAAEEEALMARLYCEDN